MRRFWIWLFFVVVVCFARTSEARKLALLVGVDDYDDVPSLKCCVNDMKTLKEALVKIGFAGDDIQVLLTGGESREYPTKKKIERRISEILSNAGPKDLVFLAFSGHGAQEGQTVYFCPPDVETDDLDGTCVSITQVMNDLARCKAKFKWMVVDACRNDPKQGAKGIGGKGLQIVPSPPEGIALFQSCARGEESWEDQESGNGYFTKNFAAALSGKADANHDGKLTLLEVCTWTTDQTKEQVLTNLNKSQKPYISGSVSDFILTKDLNVPKAKELAAEAQKAMDEENYALAIEKFDAALALCPQFESWKRERNLAQKFLDQKQQTTPPPAVPAPAEPTPAGTTLPASSRKAGDRMVLTVDGIDYAFRWCPPGEFMMGGPRSEWNGSKMIEKSDQHRVKLTRGFWLLETEVTQEMWQSVMGKNPSSFKGEQKPVERVSWEDCQSFCRKLGQKLGQQVKLPTEAQWEYACRAGTTGDYEETLFDMAWCLDNSRQATHAVGQKKPNAWGLYDMHGNVWEWCSDYYDYEYYDRSPTSDPENTTASPYRVIRGGGWNRSAEVCQSASRGSGVEPGYRSIFLGLRVSLVPSPEE